MYHLEECPMADIAVHVAYYDFGTVSDGRFLKSLCSYNYLSRCWSCLCETQDGVQPYWLISSQ